MTLEGTNASGSATRAKLRAWAETKLITSSPNEQLIRSTSRSITWAEILAQKNLSRNQSQNNNKASKELTERSQINASSSAKVAAWLKSLPSPELLKAPESFRDEVDASKPRKHDKVPKKATKNRKKVLAVHRLKIRIKSPKEFPSFTELRKNYDSSRSEGLEKMKIVEKNVKIQSLTASPSRRKPMKPKNDSSLLHFFLNELNTVITPDTQRLWDKQQWQQEKTLLSLMREKPSTVHKQVSSLINECLKLTDLHLKQKSAIQRHKEHQNMTSLKFAAKNSLHRRKASKIQAQAAAAAAQNVLHAQRVKHLSVDQQRVLNLGRAVGKARKQTVLEEQKEKRTVRKQVDEQVKGKLEKIGQDYREKVKRWGQELTEEAGKDARERREVESEVRRLRKQLKQELNQEMQLALQRLMQRREHRQFLKEEKATQLMEEIRRAKYVIK